MAYEKDKRLTDKLWLIGMESWEVVNKLLAFLLCFSSYPILMKRRVEKQTGPTEDLNKQYVKR